MATTDIKKEIQSLSPSALIELFILDHTNLQYPGILRFHDGTNELQGDIVWAGNTYIALPIEAKGFELSTKGTLPRPNFKVANMDGMFSAEVALNKDLVGAKIIRKRTYARYLDAVNFESGVNPTADPNQSYPDETWYVEQKLSENRYVIEWELASPMDLNDVMLPGRQVIQNSCPWVYRETDCGYTGAAMFDAQDQSTANPANDRCAHRLNSCIIRKAGFSGGVLRFGGYPGANRYDQN